MKRGIYMIINFSDEQPNLSKEKKSIFLAGPTVRNSKFILSWRKNACDILQNLGFDGIVYVPEFKESNNPMEFLEQAGWERQCLKNADVIVFYLCREFPEIPGLTTNVEYGMWLVKKPDACLLCSPKQYNKNRYLDWLYTQEKPNSVIYKDLKSVLKAAIEL